MAFSMLAPSKAIRAVVSGETKTSGYQQFAKIVRC